MQIARFTGGMTERIFAYLIVCLPVCRLQQTVADPGLVNWARGQFVKVERRMRDHRGGKGVVNFERFFPVHLAGLNAI